MLRPHRFVMLLSAFALFACSGSSPPPPPADVPEDSFDATPDMLPDVAPDVVSDVTPDATPDVTSDATPDVTPDANDGGAPPLRITMCPGATMMPPAMGTCTVTAGSRALLLTGDVLTPGEVLRGGQVAVDTMGIIRCVGCDCASSPAAMGATAVTCPRGVISPGLINTHDHLTFAQNNPYTVTPERYEHRHDWRRGQRGHTRLESSGGASTDQVAWGELRFVLGGATAVNGSGGVAGFLRNLDSNNMDGLGQPVVEYQTFPLGDSGGETLLSGCGYPMIDTTAYANRFEAYTPHVAEGIGQDARNEFLCMRSGANDLVLRQSAFIHGVGLLAPEIAEMAHDGTALIWSPRSNITLYGDTARVTEYARAGVRIAIGSDWIVSGSMNMLRELRCADGLNRNFFGGFFSDEALWLMATRDAAAALHVDDAIGILAVGRQADIAIFNGAMRRDHRAVLDAAPGDVVLVLKGANALYGDSTVVGALNGGTMCDPLDVCGTAKRVCVASQMAGRSLATLTMANSTRYPLFFCDEPRNEPSCLPARNAMTPSPVVNGSTRYSGMSRADDSDGDGIVNTMDNCPTVFNPVRPVDNGRQANFDGDMLGDACDPCPMQPNAVQCRPFDPMDRDGDGTPDSRDNCPETANPTQTDRDMDMRGDACDPCPDAPNPGMTGCPATIYAIKRGMFTTGARVTVTGALVTAIARNGFYMQADPMGAMYMGADHSGIFVFTGTMPTVMRGDRVNVANGTVASFFGQTQITGATVMGTASGVTLPAPTVVPAAMIATGGARAAALEGTLVRVENVTVTNPMPAPAGGETAPTNEFEVEGALRVDDGLFLITPPPMMGERFASITGVLGFARENFKLLPRAATDVVAGTPTLAPFTTELVFARVGPAAAPTIPTALSVQLTRAVATDTTVMLSSSGSGLVVSNVVVPAGRASVELPVRGVTASATPYTLTATLGMSTQTARVRVIGEAEVPRLVSLTPATATVSTGATLTLTAAVDIPAPMGGTAITLMSSAGGAVPTMVTIAANAQTARFDFTAGMAAAMSTVTATLGADMQTSMITVREGPPGALVINEIDYDNVMTDNAEFVELFNGTNDPVDLSRYALVLVNGANNMQYTRVALTGTLPPNGYAVIAPATVLSTLPMGVLRIMSPAASDWIQNGAPDGVALLNTMTNRVVDALSYEGTISAGVIPGVMGVVNLVEGTATMALDVNETVGSLARIPNGFDRNNAMMDWVFTANVTPGVANRP